jgi:chromosome segregation ATPase
MEIRGMEPLELDDNAEIIQALMKADSAVNAITEVFDRPEIWARAIPELARIIESLNTRLAAAERLVGIYGADLHGFREACDALTKQVTELRVEIAARDGAIARQAALIEAAQEYIEKKEHTIGALQGILERCVKQGEMQNNGVLINAMVTLEKMG